MGCYELCKADSGVKHVSTETHAFGALFGGVHPIFTFTLDILTTVIS